MKKLAMAAILGALLPLAAAASTDLYPRTFYYLDGQRVTAASGAYAVEPSDANNLPFSTSSHSYTFSALPPAGHRLDEWRVSAESGILNAYTLDALTSRRTYTGDPVEVRWATNYTYDTNIYLTPCFSWLEWKLAYKSNNTSIAGDYGTVDLVYTNSVTVAQPSSLWSANVTGYDVAGWSLSPTGSIEFTSGQVVERAGEALGAANDGATVYLYAVWQKREMQIALDAQGGNVASNSVIARIEEKYSLPTPQRQGFIFLGWYTDPVGGTSIVSGVTTVTRDDITRLYARWQLISYRLAYDWNWSGAGGGAPTSRDYGYTNTVTLAEGPVSWSRPGYSFVGWALTDTTTPTFTTGQTIAMAGSAFGVDSDDQNVTLYGVWQKQPLTISLDARGGTVSQATVTAYIDERYELPVPVREGFVFTGWYTMPAGGTAIANGSRVESVDITTLYAQWQLIEFTLAYHENAGDGSRRSYQRCGWTNTVAISALPNAWARTGWDFLGWTRSQGGTAADFSAGQNVAMIGRTLGAVQGGTNTLYAVWERRRMTIMLDGQGYDVEPAEVVVCIDDKYELPDLTHARRDAWFLGWWTQSTGGEQIQNGDDVTRDDISTLYAQWKPKEIYNVGLEFRDASGAVTNTTQSVYERDPAEMPSTDDELSAWIGHTFLHWEPEDYDYNCITSHVNFTAIYKTNEYDVAFFANGGQGFMPRQHFFYDEAQNLTNNVFTYGKTEAWTFAGWALEEDAMVPDYADGESVSNLTAEDGAIVWLNAVWADNLNDYSRHIDSDLVFTTDDIDLWSTATVLTNGWQVITNQIETVETNTLGQVETVYVDDIVREPLPPVQLSVLDLDGTDMDFGTESVLSARVLGSGKLHFSWVSTVEDSGIHFTFTTNYVYYDENYEKWKTNGVTVYEAPMTTNWTSVVWTNTAARTDWTDISWRVPSIGVDNHFYLTDVVWEPDGKFFVSFDANGGEGTMEPVTFYVGDFGTLPRNLFTFTGYTFSGWEDPDGARYDDRGYSSAWTNDTVLTAQWEPIEYSLRFLANGGENEMPEQRLTYNRSAQLSANGFERTGYTFAGWLHDGTMYADRATVSNLTATAEAVLDFEAQWEANKYTIAYDANGGEGAAGAPQQCTYDTPATLAPNPFTRTGYTFAGWEFDDVMFDDGQVVTNLTDEANGAVTLAATWAPITYTIRFEAGADDATGSTQPIALVYDAPSSLPSSGFSRTGYAFAGWVLDGRHYGAGDQVENLADSEGAEVVMTAQWTPNSYSVTFVANGGEGEMRMAAMSYGVSAALPAGEFTRTGYRLVGWATSATGAMAYGDGQDVANLASDQGATVELYAVWQPISYAVRFDANGGAGDMADVVAAYDTPTNLPPCAFTFDRHEFRCWLFNGVEYADEAAVLNLTATDGDVLVFAAQWDETEAADDPSDPSNPSNPDFATFVFPAGAEEIGGFTAATAAKYTGWLRDTQTGGIAALISVKTTAVKKQGALSRSTIKVTPFSGKKATYKTEVEPGGNPVDEYGIVYGDVGLSGTFDGYKVEAALDFSKAKTQDKRALVAEMPSGVWSCAFDAGDAYTTFAVTVSRNGKAKVTGYLADGKKVSASSQGVLGSGYAFAVPVVNAKKGVGFVLWISPDGTVEVTDCANADWSVAAKSGLRNLSDGLHALTFSMPTWRAYVTATDREGVSTTPIGEATISVAGGKWKALKTVGKLALDASSSPVATYVKIKEGLTPVNLAALKMSCTAKNGLAKGSFKLWYIDGGRLRSDKVTITGAAVDGRFLGTARVKGRDPFKIESAE